MQYGVKSVLRVGVMSIVWPVISCAVCPAATADCGKPPLLNNPIENPQDPVRSTLETPSAEMTPVAVPLPPALELGVAGLAIAAGFCWKKPRWLAGRNQQGGY